MSKPIVKIKKLPNYKGLPDLTRGSELSSGLDIRVALHGISEVEKSYLAINVLGGANYYCHNKKSIINNRFTLYPEEFCKIPTGIAIELPAGYEAQGRSRSGLAANHGVVVLHGVGTIDNDYRGELFALMVNHGNNPVIFKHGDRIFQLVIAPVIIPEIIYVDELSDTKRGAGGFGHTGI